VNNYIIGNYYIINPFGTNNYTAEFVGWMRLKENNKLPVFKFNFYPFGNPECFTVLENKKWVAGGRNIEGMIEDFKNQIDYFGNSHNLIKIIGGLVFNN